jgi:sporulation protein YlmC with PRC-barrel domain
MSANEKPRREPIEPRVLDNLRPGAEVFSADGKEVGTLHAVIVDPRDDDITHIAVNAGPHFPAIGFGAPRIVSVPIEEMTDAREKKIILKITRRKFLALPDYAEWHFGSATDAWEPPEGLERAGAVAPVALIQRGMGVWALPVPAEIRHREPFEREILDGGRVWRVVPHTFIGNIERVLIDEVTDEIRALVIERGPFFGRDVILPIEFVTEIEDVVVYVDISDEELEELEEFLAPPEP